MFKIYYLSARSLFLFPIDISYQYVDGGTRQFGEACWILQHFMRKTIPKEFSGRTVKMLHLNSSSILYPISSNRECAF